jgi:predicted site-specific integrase-resolvase
MSSEPFVLAMNESQAAAALGMTKNVLRKHTRGGRIPCVKIGDKTIYPVDVLKEFLMQNASPKAEETLKDK